MAERLVIEIDGNATGLTKALSQGQQKLGIFNTQVAAGNKSLQNFQRGINTTVTSLGRLTAGSNTLKTSLASLNRTVNTTNTGLGRLDKQSRTSAASVKSFTTALGGAQRRVDGLSNSARGAGASLTSLNRRTTALSATISALNTQLRALVSSATAAGGATSATAAGATKAATATAAAGNAAGMAAGRFALLHRSTLSMAEGFRRTVAQITALRTLTYQALFWFAPLIYSVIKVNMQYEKQMVLLKNLSTATNRVAKEQEAIQTRNWLLDKATTNPFSMEQITDAFVKMRVGGVDPLNGSLQTLMDSVAAFGGSNANLERAAVAIQQMGGKGVISMEELRQQLGEHIPTATKAMAAGMGMTLRDLYKQIELGNVESTTALKKMFAVLQVENAGAARRMMNTWSGLMARLGTAWQKFIVKLTEAGGADSFISTLKGQIENFIQFLNTPQGFAFARDIQQGLSSLLRSFVAIIKIIYTYREAIITAAKVFAVIWGGKLIIGTLARVIGMYVAFNRIISVAILTLIRLTTTKKTAAAASLLFGSNVRIATTRLIAMNGAASLSIGRLALLAARFSIAAAAALATAAAIWLVVKALNAKSLAEQNAELAKRASEGGVWENKDEQTKAYNKLIASRDRLNAARKTKSGQYLIDQGGMTISVSAEKFAEMQQEHNQGVAAFKAVQANQKAMSNSAKTSHLLSTESDKYESMKETASNLNRQIYGSTSTKDSAKAGNTALAGIAKNMGEMYRKKAEEATDTATRRAYSQLADKADADYAQYTGGKEILDVPNAFVDDGKDKGAGSKKNNTGSQVDPLERWRNRYATEFTQSQELEHEYKNLRDGTDSVFDIDAAEDLAVLTAAKIKDEAALRNLINAEKERQEELKKSIQVEKAIIGLRSDTADQNADTALGYEKLKVGYESIELASKEYSMSLEREYREELAITEARIASGQATEEQIAQYKRLKDAIIESTRAKEAALLLEVASDAKDANEAYDASFRTGRQQANYESNLELKRIQEALNFARTDLDRYYETKNKLNDQLAEARDRLAEAEAQSNELAGENARADIEVIGQRIAQEDETNKLIRESIPYLERRIQILQEEEGIRNRMGGFIGPIYDWAKEANKGFESIRETMGQLVTEGLDDLISGFIDGKMAFMDFAKTILKGLIAIILRALIAKAILSALGLSGGSGAVDGAVASGELNLNATNGTWTQGVGGGHGGMIAGGTARFHRSISPAAFAFAKRYHTGGIVGLRDNEVPIIAEKGEGVFTEEQMKALGQSKNGSNVQVNVVNQTGVQAEVERQPPKFDGEKWVEQIILKKMVTAGPVRDAFSAMNKR